MLPETSLHELEEETRNAITKLLDLRESQINTIRKDPKVVTSVEYDGNQIYKFTLVSS